jgi:hypothetical protein
MTSAQEFRKFALECGKQAAATQDERLRKVLMGTARLWMDIALQIERSWALMNDEEPVTVKNEQRL